MPQLNELPAKIPRKLKPTLEKPETNQHPAMTSSLSLSPETPLLAYSTTLRSVANRVGPRSTFIAAPFDAQDSSRIDIAQKSMQNQVINPAPSDSQASPTLDTWKPKQKVAEDYEKDRLGKYAPFFRAILSYQCQITYKTWNLGFSSLSSPI